MKKPTKKELEYAMAHLTELHAKEGGIEGIIKADPAVYQYVAQCFAEALVDAPNYMEMKFEMMAGRGTDNPQWITVTVQKGSGKTPHELRKVAEDKLAEFERTVDST